jgi:hypothetical protein
MSAIKGIRMKNPAHPGGFVKSEIVEALELSVTDAAKALGVTRPALSALLNERAAPSSRRRNRRTVRRLECRAAVCRSCRSSGMRDASPLPTGLRRTWRSTLYG